jgi:hypothetical protein
VSGDSYSVTFSPLLLHHSTISTAAAITTICGKNVEFPQKQCVIAKAAITAFSVKLTIGTEQTAGRQSDNKQTSKRENCGCKTVVI